MKIREYIKKIGENKNIEDMNKLGEMLENALYTLKKYDEEAYCDYKMNLYEMAYGKKINQETAEEWVKSMKPVGKHWTINETTEAMRSLGYNLDAIDFFIAANMMYNDHYNTVKDKPEEALPLGYEWLNDEDAGEYKLYNYARYVVRNPKIF